MYKGGASVTIDGSTETGNRSFLINDSLADCENAVMENKPKKKQDKNFIISQLISLLSPNIKKDGKQVRQKIKPADINQGY